MAEEAPGAAPLVFQIGFNRCGTRSLWSLFRNNGHPAVHWGNGRLGRRICRNVAAGRVPLDGIRPASLYADMETVGERHFFEGYRRFRALDAAYPHARFVLNTRHVEDWIASRFRLGDGAYAAALRRLSGAVSDAALAEDWRIAWHGHHAAVLAHFRGRADTLFVWDIDRTDPAALCAWLAPVLSLDPARMEHLHRSRP